MVQLHEMILRDGHQSLLATRMRTEDMLPIAGKLDEVGFFSLEVWGGATYDVCIRYLNQDPWERLNQLKKAMPNTPLQMLERAMNIVAYWNFPDDVVKKFIYYAKKNGCDYFRIFDALNDLRNLKVPMQAAKENGGHVQACLSYTISPIHTVDYFVDKFIELKKMGADSVCIKDMAGMISPKRAYDIIKGTKEAGVNLPMDLHSHYTSGMTGMAYQRAVEAGADILDTSLSPISGGTAAPATESVVAAFQGTEWDTNYNLELLIECRAYFLKVWEKYRHLHRFDALKVDPSVTLHQVPGGMLSNLIFQLEEQGARDKYRQILEETARVRDELGYPPLVTPTSQVVGVQAVMNVLHGRYKVIPKETKDYCRGMYGKAPGEIKPEIMKRVLGPNWKEEVIDCRPSDLLEPLWDAKKKELQEIDGGSLIKKEEDIMTYILYPQVGLKFLKGQAIAEFTSDILPLPLDHQFTRAMVKQSFPEVKQLWLETQPPEKRGGPVQIPTEFQVEVDGEPFEVKVIPSGGYLVAGAAGSSQQEKPKDIEGGIKSNMQGTILKIKVKKGDKVKIGDVIATVEAMKMEQEIKCEAEGEVKEIFCKEGSPVSSGDLLMQIL
ncbi:MAG: pyruvate/oxaloacetate carboxyltransferase [Candidatus Thermoplasmatota archaeon]|nr:pyruvate/oxaloacetate carboxyltransferase [Candidatus Thermoplasmatota archaeon]